MDLRVFHNPFYEMLETTVETEVRKRAGLQRNTHLPMGWKMFAIWEELWIRALKGGLDSWDPP